MRSVVKLRVTSGTGGRWFESNLLSTMRGVAQLVRAPVYSLLMGVPRSYWENGWWRSLRVTSSVKERSRVRFPSDASVSVAQW